MSHNVKVTSDCKCLWHDPSRLVVINVLTENASSLRITGKEDFFFRIYSRSDYMAAPYPAHMCSALDGDRINCEALWRSVIRRGSNTGRSSTVQCFEKIDR